MVDYLQDPELRKPIERHAMALAEQWGVPSRQEGGFVGYRRPYMVGEKGPEILHMAPGSSGYVSPIIPRQEAGPVGETDPEFRAAQLAGPYDPWTTTRERIRKQTSKLIPAARAREAREKEEAVSIPESAIPGIQAELGDPTWQPKRKTRPTKGLPKPTDYSKSLAETGEEEIRAPLTITREGIPTPSGPQVPWAKEGIPGGGTRYTLEGGQGTMTLPADWKTPTREEALSTVSPIAERTRRGLIAEAEVGLPPRRSLAEKEKEEYGGMEPPGEFSYDKYTKALQALGGKPSLKTRVGIFEHMQKSHEEQQKRWDEMQKHMAEFGLRGTARISAEAEARHKNIEDQLAMIEAPAKVGKLLAEKAHLMAEASESPAKAEQYRAHAKQVEASIDKPEFEAANNILKNRMLGIKEMLPNQQSAAYDKAIEEYKYNHSMVNIAIKLRKKYPSYNIPDLPVPGQIYDVAPGIKWRWTGQGYEAVPG